MKQATVPSIDSAHAPEPSPIAKEALERIAALYAVEKDIRGRSAEQPCTREAVR